MDPVVRTCGESTKVKNIEVEKQIREPLNLKYKKFQGIKQIRNHNQQRI